MWVVRESLVGLCVYFGGTKKDFVEGGGDQINRGGPRIAWPVLGTPALLLLFGPLLPILLLSSFIISLSLSLIIPRVICT